MPETTVEKRSLPASGSSGWAGRARVERMAVRTVGGGQYDVLTADDAVYSVNLPKSRCTCPDHRYRGARCKHLCRVAIEVTEGRVPAPGEREASCGACGERLFAPEKEPDPVYCPACTLGAGDLVRDREGGDLLVVAATLTGRAGEVRAGEFTVADYPGNEAYPESDAVVEAVYPPQVGTEPESVRRYRFPRSRLGKVR
jgi:hypothetical protein